jgi:hypothetical protein
VAKLGELFHEYLGKEFGGEVASVGLGGLGDATTVVPAPRRAVAVGRFGGSTLLLMAAVACVLGVLIGTGVANNVFHRFTGHCLIFYDCKAAPIGAAPPGAAAGGPGGPAVGGPGILALAQAAPSPLTPAAASFGPTGANPSFGGGPAGTAPGPAAGSLLHGVVGVVGNAVPLVTSTLDGAVGGLGTALTTTVNGLVPALSPAVNGLVGTVGSTVSGVGSLLNTAVGGLAVASPAQNAPPS